MNLLLPLCLRVGCGRTGEKSTSFLFQYGIFSHTIFCTKMRIHRPQIVIPISVAQCSASPSLAPPDVPKMRQADISFALTVMLHALQPPASTKLASSGVPGGAVGGSVTNKTDAGLFSTSETRGHSTVRPSIYSVAFLGKYASVAFLSTYRWSFSASIGCLPTHVSTPLCRLCGRLDDLISESTRAVGATVTSGTVTLIGMPRRAR